MISQKFKAALSQQINGGSHLADLWNCENFMVFFPELNWKSPTTETDDNNWESIKRFEGKATLLLQNEKSVDLIQLIAKITQPIKMECDPNTPAGQLDIQMQWLFDTQRDSFTEMTLVTQLEGQLRGTLLRRK
jgi:hypothetical protein